MSYFAAHAYNTARWIFTTLIQMFVMPPLVTLPQIPAELPYQPANSRKNPGLHLGQRKLLLKAVEFLSQVIARKPDTKFCIYAGAAPGNTLLALSNLFPQITFIAVDPAKFDLTTENGRSHRCTEHDDIVHIYSGYGDYNGYRYTSRNTKPTKMSDSKKEALLDYLNETDRKICIIEDCFTPELAEMLSALPDKVFMSDIRTNIASARAPTDYDIVLNAAMVHVWMNKLAPDMACLKFRTPYFTGMDFSKSITPEHTVIFETAAEYGIDYLKDYKEGKFRSAKAELWIQPWCGRSSTELRAFCIEFSNDITDVDAKSLESKMYAYNKLFRYGFHLNQFADRALHFCHCNDCSLESVIWQSYMSCAVAESKAHFQVVDFVRFADAVTQKPLQNRHYLTVWNASHDFDQFISEISLLMNKSSSYIKNTL
jgi:hypothetical protein